MMTTASSHHAGTDNGSEQTDWPRPIYAWYVIAVLTLAYTISFLDRQILYFLVQPIRQDLHISDFQISLLMGIAFASFYTLLGIPISRLADRTNRRNIIVIGIVSWSIMTSVCGLTRNFGQLFLARMGVGVGEATLTPAAYSMVSDYFPEEKRSLAYAIYALGVPFGIGASLVIGKALALTAAVLGPAGAALMYSGLEPYRQSLAEAREWGKTGGPTPVISKITGVK